MAIAIPMDRQRIIDHGEVFTPAELVSDMLDLVAHECEREDSRFLEPACGDGNFLTEVLRRRLLQIDEKHRAQAQWEAHALLGLACLYGIELLGDNVSACRARLTHQFEEHYRERFGVSASEKVIGAVRLILRCNIIQGDALRMTAPSGEPLVLTEWSLVGRGRFKRRLYEYRELVPHSDQGASLFGQAAAHDEDGRPVFIPSHVRDLPTVHYLNLAEREGA
jgi:hypothetical protein